jgi:hypothetical protein
LTWFERNYNQTKKGVIKANQKPKDKAIKGRSFQEEQWWGGNRTLTPSSASINGYCIWPDPNGGNIDDCGKPLWIGDCIIP